MVDFSIKALTAPFVPTTTRCFDKIAGYIVEKHPTAIKSEVNHDLKALMFDAATAMIVSTVALAYFKTIALVTAVAWVVLFYLVRRIIDETIVPIAAPQKTNFQEVKGMTQAWLSREKKATKPDVREIFQQGTDVRIGSVILLKLTHQPLTKMIRMIFTRSA